MKLGYRINLFLHSPYFCRKLHPLENITTGHWIFAAIFTVGFSSYLFWSYQKDAEVHAMHYGKSIRFLLSLVVLLFIIYIFKRL